MLQKLYDWCMRMAAHKNAMGVLALVSFTESSFFPLPVDALIVPMALADRRRAWRVGVVATVFSVLGGIAGYGIGYFLFDTVGQPILEFYGAMENFAVFKDMYNEWGAWIVAGAGLTPFPYKVITIASGVTQLDVWTFMIASVLSRGFRFMLEVALLYWIGPPIKDFIEKRLVLVTTLMFVLLIGGFVAIRYLF